MKYQLGDTVMVKATGRIGKINHFKKDEYYSFGRLTSNITYGVIFQPYYTTVWHKEDDICYPDIFDDEFELGFATLMIDANLLVHNFHMTKVYADIKKDLERGV